MDASSLYLVRIHSRRLRCRPGASTVETLFILQSATPLLPVLKQLTNHFMTTDNQDETVSSATAKSSAEVPIVVIPSNIQEMSPTELILTTERMDPTTRAVVEAAKQKQQQQQQQNETDTVAKYPIDLPSPLLLASSMVLAIISTGMCCPPC
jgi:hypothetical protein